jgi:hypothetical protein
MLAERVAMLIRQSAEVIERSKSIQAAHAALLKELEEKKEVTKNLYSKLQIEKQVCLLTFVVTNWIPFTISHHINSRTKSRVHLEYGRTVNSSCFLKKNLHPVMNLHG